MIRRANIRRGGYIQGAYIRGAYIRDSTVFILDIKSSLSSFLQTLYQHIYLPRNAFLGSVQTSQALIHRLEEPHFFAYLQAECEYISSSQDSSHLT